MTGIAGAISVEPAGLIGLLGRMAEALRVFPGSETEQWVDPHATLCRVRNPSVDAGHQPVFSEDGRKCMFFFGECFGYESSRRDLVRQGHRFSDQPSDAEYVLRLYERYGEVAFGMLSGSFCLAIYDCVERTLRLVSDRLGSRPLFYGAGGKERFVFATRVSPLLTDPGVGRDLDIPAVLEFCTLQKVLEWKTYHSGVSMLPPASILRCRNGAVEVTRYWTPHYEPQSGTLDDYAEQLAETLRAAMSDVTRGTESAGILLSGGLDGRMMVAATEKPLTCYCFGDYENPEFDAARKVAEAKGFDIHFLRREPDHYPGILDRAVELGSGMHPFNHAHALGFLEQIGQRTPVVTHGYGVEALFRGTTLPKATRSLGGVAWRSRLDPTLSEESLPSRYHRRAYSLLGRYPGLFAPGVADGLEGHLEESARKTIADATPHCSNPFDKLLWSDVFARSRYTGYLFLLAMRPFVVERSVLFDNRLIDLHLKVPLSLRSDNRLWLKAMTRLDRRVARVINANTGYGPGAPAWLLAGLKRVRRAWREVPRLGSAVRQHEAPRNALAGLSPTSWPRFDWLVRSNERLRDRIAETLGDSEALPDEVFNREEARRIFAEHLSGRRGHRDVLFALLTFGIWHKAHAGHERDSLASEWGHGLPSTLGSATE